MTATMPTVRAAIRDIVQERRVLSRAEARELLQEMLTGAATDMEIAALLTALAMRGETAEELAGFAEGMRALSVPVLLSDAERARLVDTCGTGGDGLGTFNISTGAALVAAAAGALVAKHGNRAVTSKCGSADVLEALGIPVALSPAQSVACLRATGFMFLYAPALQPAMARVAPVRRALGFRTIFNLAGPLTNPAGAPAQVMGVWAKSKVEIVADAMMMLGVGHAFVVHGQGLDELTVTGASHAIEVQAAVLRRFSLEPGEVGLSRAELSTLDGGSSAEASAAVLLSIFRGQERGAPREIVALNAAAALVAGGLVPDLRVGIERAGAAIDCGAVLSLLERLQAYRPKNLSS